MHYQVDGKLIKTENMARSIKQASNYLNTWIGSHKKVDRTLDYGCGKLRYCEPLSKISNFLTIVDSDIQINRNQTINGRITTIKDYISGNLTNTEALTTQEFITSSSKFSFILCANVLSAIPIIETRSEVLTNLLSCLNEDGECLFVSQYANSFYKKLDQDPHAKPYLDGYLVTRNNITSYFGILDKKRIENLVHSHGFLIKYSWINDQSAYVLATI